MNIRIVDNYLHLNYWFNFKFIFRSPNKFEKNSQSPNHRQKTYAILK